MLVFDQLGEGTYHAFRVEEVLAKTRSPLQEILICRLTDFGKALFLDNSLQCAQADQKIYHEALIAPALLTVEQPKRVLIIGGGDGAAANMVLSQKETKLTIVEIDKTVVQLSKKLLKEFHDDVFENPDLEVVYSDGKKFVEKTNETFDLIIIDVTDPGVGDLSESIYNQSFFEFVRSHLSGNGLVVTQAGSAWFRKDSFIKIGKSIKDVFPSVVAYGEFIHSFGSLWGYYVAGNLNLKKQRIYSLVKKMGYTIL